MKVAIMQPYFLPYIGYFQLIAAVDKFVIYDDVNYIKGGWINRNNMLMDNKASLFTIPLVSPSSFSKINSIKINQKLFPLWKKKLIKSITQSYKKAPYFEKVFELIERILLIEDDETISFLATKAIKEIVLYLDIKTEIIDSSMSFKNNDLKSFNRVIDICSQIGATHYINPIGGSILYDKTVFMNNGIKLNFIQSKEIIYKQFNDDFIPWLSIIDALMFNNNEELKCILNKYELV